MADIRIIEVDGTPFVVPNGTLTSADILVFAGLDQRQNNVIIRTDNGRACSVDPLSKISLPIDAHASFQTFHNGRLYHLKVSGNAWDWGAPAIEENVIRRIADISDDCDLCLAGGSGSEIRRGSVIDLTTANVPHIVVDAPRRKTNRMPIVVNGRTREIEGSETSFEQLVRIAFPGVTDPSRRDRSLTVIYRGGPPDRPEGSLIPHQSVRLQRGAVFHVTATDKS